VPCPLSAVLLSAANQSLNFHESHTLPDNIENLNPHVHEVSLCVERTLFALPDVTVNFPQVAFQVWFYNEMLINVDNEFKRIILGASPQK
jgi:hypothetical protein